jgi:hypothetical protein
MNKIPLLDSVAHVLTFRSYHRADENQNIDVKVPQVEMDNTHKGNDSKDTTNETDQFVVDVNAEINKIVDGYVTKAEKDIAEYKKAFLDTGGSQKEWEEKKIKVNVDYKVEYQKGTTLSLVLIANENWCNAYNVKYYYNLDLTNNKKLTLQNVLGEDYIAIANDSITKQMQQRMKEDSNNIYWGIDGDTSGFPGFKTVDENTKFYINQEGNPVICFEKYEIAPGSMGSQEFEIKK